MCFSHGASHIAVFVGLSCRRNRRTKAATRTQPRMPKQPIPRPCLPSTQTTPLRGRGKIRLVDRPKQSAANVLPQPKHEVDCASISTTSDTEFLCLCPTTLLPTTSSEEKVQRQSRSLAVEEGRKPSGPNVRSGVAAPVRNFPSSPPSAPSSNLPCSS